MDKPDDDLIDGLPPDDDLPDGLPPDVEVLEDGSIRFYDCFGNEIRMTREQLEEIETTGKLGDPDEDMGEPYPYFNFVKVDPCTFMMGSPPDEKGRHDGETQHLVTLTKPFHIMTTPFTQAMWDAILGQGFDRFTYKHPDNPVTEVSYWDVLKFIEILNSAMRPLVFRLPTEAEWECACRAGTTGATYAPLDEIAWYRKSAVWGPQPVAQKAPNAWGIYDMLGNVDEWCQDIQGPYPSDPVTDPTSPTVEQARIRFKETIRTSDGSEIPEATYPRITRGGCCSDVARDCRAASRKVCFSDFANSSKLGFRLVTDDITMVGNSIKLK